MEYIKLQKYYVRCLFKTNEANDINNVKSIFKNKFNISLKLTNQEIYYEKHIGLGTLQNLDIKALCKKISNEDIKVNIRTQDIVYNYKKKI